MTPLQTKALDFIRDVLTAGHTPSVRELARCLDLQPSGAQRVIDLLVERGYLTKSAGEARSLRLVDVPDLRGVGTDMLANELARRGVTLASLSTHDAIASSRQRTCAADTCGNAVQRGHLMCRTHWFALPQALRERVLRTNSARDQHGFERAVTEARDLIDSGDWRQRA